MLDSLNSEYVALHTEREEAFWAVRTGLGDAETQQQRYEAAERRYTRWLSDDARIQAVRDALAASTHEEERLCLSGWERMMAAQHMSAEARALAEEILDDEGRLHRARAAMTLSYEHPDTGSTDATSVELRLIVMTSPDPRLREAAWRSLRGVERFVLDNGFLDIVKKRNRLGRMLGAEDFYDARVQRVEGMTKARIYELLDALEEATRESARTAIDTLREWEGEMALLPWNLDYNIAGDVTEAQDPYFPFNDAVGRWVRTFSALGIDYRGAEVVCDLVQRTGKHDNGFCHGPQIAWRERGTLHPARIQFTANAIPGRLGSGSSAMRTLFHEGGHAAHFANVDMPSPCFGHEYAPMSVAVAETQSMFLDALLSDPAWMTRYARNEAGEPIPWEIIERGIRAKQPFYAWGLRGMLAVCYAERALYEIPDDELTAASAMAAVAAAEQRLLFVQRSPRPTLSVPHLLYDGSSAYYHAYVLARMAVEQTREFFLERDGHIVDNGAVGQALADGYWRPGAQFGFEEFVKRMTGSPISHDPLARRANRSADETIALAQTHLGALESVPEVVASPDLNAHLKVVHGDQLVADTARDGDLAGVSAVFADWVASL